MLQRTDESQARSAEGRAMWVAAALLFAIWLTMLLLGGAEVDRRLLIAGYAGDTGWMPVAVPVTRLGDWEVLIALTFLACGWLILRHQWRLAGLLVGSTLLARLAVTLQKMLFARIRPAENEHLVEVQTLSFPSGHAANSMVVYLLLALFLIREEGARRIAITGAVLLSLLIGVSRVMVAVHWPSDVIGGWAFGLMWVMAVCHLRPRWAPRR